MFKRVAVAMSVCVLLVGCASSSSDTAGASDKKTTSKKSAKPKPAFDKKTYAAALVKSYTTQLGGKTIKSSCTDTTSGNWQCYYDGIKVNGKSFIYINMSTPGDVSKDQAQAFSKKARLAWFNFVGADFPKLETIVTMVNGADTGTTRRSDVPLLNR